MPHETSPEQSAKTSQFVEVEKGDNSKIANNGPLLNGDGSVAYQAPDGSYAYAEIVMGAKSDQGVDHDESKQHKVVLFHNKETGEKTAVIAPVLMAEGEFINPEIVHLDPASPLTAGTAEDSDLKAPQGSAVSGRHLTLQLSEDGEVTLMNEGRTSTTVEIQASNKEEAALGAIATTDHNNSADVNGDSHEAAQETPLLTAGRLLRDNLDAVFNKPDIDELAVQLGVDAELAERALSVARQFAGRYSEMKALEAEHSLATETLENIKDGSDYDLWSAQIEGRLAVAKGLSSQLKQIKTAIDNAGDKLTHLENTELASLLSAVKTGMAGLNISGLRALVNGIDSDQSVGKQVKAKEDSVAVRVEAYGNDRWSSMDAAKLTDGPHDQSEQRQEFADFVKDNNYDIDQASEHILRRKAELANTPNVDQFYEHLRSLRSLVNNLDSAAYGAQEAGERILALDPTANLYKDISAVHSRYSSIGYRFEGMYDRNMVDSVRGVEARVANLLSFLNDSVSFYEKALLDSRSSRGIINQLSYDLGQSTI